MKIIDKTIEYGLYALIFLLPIQTRWIARSFETGVGNIGRGFVEYPSISIYATDILLGFLLILFLIKFLSNFKEILSKGISKMQCFIAGIDVFIFVSIFFAIDKGLGVYRYILFFIASGLFFLVIKARYDKKKLFFAFFMSLLFQGVFAIWQFLTQEAFAFKWLGLASHSPLDLGASVIEVTGDNIIGERWLRAYGTLDHPNILGGVLAIGLVFLLLCFVKHHSKKYPCYIISAISFVAMLFSFSRSAWLAFVMSFVFIFSVYLAKRDLRAQVKILKISILLVIIFAVIFNSYNNLFITRVSGEGRLEAKSNYERGYYFNESKEIIKDNYLFGVGIGNYIVKTISEREDDYFWTYQPVHNTFLLIIAEIGIFGFLFFAGFLMWILIMSIKKKEIFNLAILIVLFIIMSFDHWIWSLHFGILFFWFIMGILVKNIESEKQEVSGEIKKEEIKIINN